MTRSRPHFKKKQCSIFLFVSMLMTTSHVFAAFPSSMSSTCCSPLRPVFAFGAGVAFTSDAGKSKTFPIQNPITDEFFIYSAQNHSQTLGFLDVFFGAEWAFRPNWALQMGLAYNQTDNLDAKGSLIQGADIESQDQYAYRYTIYARQLLAEGKLLYNYRCIYHPYFLLGLGESFNQAKDYVTNVPPFLTFTRVYGDHSDTSFSYNVGLGIDVDMTEHLRFGVGYRFTDFGSAQLGSARIDTTNVSGTLSQSHLYTNEIIAQITFVI